MPQALEQADGRWAWVVLLASLVTQALTVGFPSCIGVFFTDLQRDFHHATVRPHGFPPSWGPCSIVGVSILKSGEGRRDCWELGRGTIFLTYHVPLSEARGFTWMS